MTSLRSTLPLAHARLLGDIFDREAVRESRATCSECAMCPRESQDPTRRPSPFRFFEPDLKCCTYFPTFPNYMVGAILADDAPDMESGKRRIRERIATRFGVTPQWLGPPRKYRVMLDASRNSSFGRSKTLLCPYFDRDQKNCSIWRHRESVCSTFFCKYELGGLSATFWSALKLYLGYAEFTLAKWARIEVAPDACEPTIPKNRMTLDDLEDRPPSDDEFFAIWGAWAGREEEMYVATHERVRALSRADFARLVDETPRGRELLEVLAASYEALGAPKLASHLTLSKKLRLVRTLEGMSITAYNTNDPLTVDEQLWDALQKLDGNETVAHALERIEREEGITISEELMLRLQNHEIVVPVSEALSPEKT